MGVLSANAMVAVGRLAGIVALGGSPRSVVGEACTFGSTVGWLIVAVACWVNVGISGVDVGGMAAAVDVLAQLAVAQLSA
jgi:hypothetical protein